MRQSSELIALAGQNTSSLGPAEACTAGIRAVAAAGAELILLDPLVDDAQQLEPLADNVIPVLS